MKNEYYITRQMQDDLIKAYNKVAPLSWTQKEAYEKAVKLPAPRYYITPKQALQVLSPMVKGNFEMVNMMLPNRKRMYYSLLEKVFELSEKRAFAGKSLSYIVQFAVASPAPEFFVSSEKLHRIRWLIKSGQLDEEGREHHPGKIVNYERLKQRRAKLREYRAQFL